MNPLRIFQVDSFTTTPFTGNPAGVVLGADGLNEQAMQSIARELNNSETAFVLAPDGPDHEVRVRFFTPTVEVPSCGHATIAAHYVRARVLGLPRCTVLQKIGAGILPVDIMPDADDYTIVMTQGAIEISGNLDSKTEMEVLSALGLLGSDRNARFPLRIASTGHSKVMVGVNSRDVLNGLRPNMAALTKLSRCLGCNGYYVFTFDSDDPEILVHGRMFAPAIGIPEDPVTGNANGPLGAYLVDRKFARTNPLVFKARQGEACGRPGTVEVTVESENGKPTLVKVAGRAVIVFEAELGNLFAPA
ncbi:MAG: PhzF family isomerase [Proteobacteria bacterium]|nr:PhzF family isomerase [Pseudomonadota bacterium]MBU1611449.1 PhzF family isomerase [Pseudomonadota bacterium]